MPTGYTLFGGCIFINCLLLGLAQHCSVPFDIFLPVSSLLSTSHLGFDSSLEMV